jgi:hypothetical protein
MELANVTETGAARWPATTSLDYRETLQNAALPALPASRRGPAGPARGADLAAGAPPFWHPPGGQG